MRCNKRQIRLYWKIIFVIILINIIVYILLFNINFIDEEEINVCSSIQSKTIDKIKYIFDLDRWRGLMLNDRIYFSSNETFWCDIPSELQSISDGICQMYNRNDCKRLPCPMIYSSLNTLEDIKCNNDGQIIKSSSKESDILCKRGFSLDLFLKSSNKSSSYPSIIIDSLTPFSNELYINVLNKNYRSCDSIWGILFNFESLTNYPWNKDKKYLNLFDVTFGYDRSIYDFIPKPWLFNYIEQIKFNSKRLSIEQIINSKKQIYSQTTSDIYWTNTQTLSFTQINSSYVTAPILWMNTNCNTPSKRTEYLNELMKFIDVDNYGTCGNNIKNLPEHIVKIQNSNNKNLKDRGTYYWEEGKLALANDYLFTIAIENSINYDYITEKLWHALIAGSIPIYLGATNILDWLPCQNNCIINLKQFKTPKDAALYIKSVASNKTLYLSYHQWRNEPVKKQFQNMINYFENIQNYSLDCIMCHMSHRVGQGHHKNNIKTKIKTTIGKF